MRKRSLFAVVLVALALLAVPWSFDIQAPAVAKPERQQMVYGPFPAQLAQLHEAAAVTKGTQLAGFEAPDLIAQQVRSHVTAQALEQRLAGLIADERGGQEKQATLRRFYEQQAESHAIDEETQRLQIKAEFDGVWLDVDPSYKPGTWVDVKTPLGVLVDPKTWVIDAYVGQGDVDRIRSGAPARFYFAGQSGGVEALVEFIDPTRTQRPVPTVLDSRYGGPISVQQQEGLEGVPMQAHYRVRLRLTDPIDGLHELRGTLHIQGERRSLLWQGVTKLLTVLIRESGF